MALGYQYGAPDVPGLQRLARASGLLYLVLAVFGLFSALTLQSLVVPGDAASTAANILERLWLFGSSLVGWIVIVVAAVAVSITLYLLLEPVSRALSLVVAALRLVYAAILGAILLNLYDAFRLLTGAGPGAGSHALQQHTMVLTSLDTLSTGFLLALVFFGGHLAALGFLLYRSRYVPRMLGILVVAAGVGYILDSLATFFVPGHGGLAGAVLVAPALVGELGLTAWLLVKGVDFRQGKATIDSFDPSRTSVGAPTADAVGGTR
jgi:hypothetical protein